MGQTSDAERGQQSRRLAHLSNVDVCQSERFQRLSEATLALAAWVIWVTSAGLTSAAVSAAANALFVETRFAHTTTTESAIAV